MKRIGVIAVLIVFCTLFFSLPSSSVETTITAGSIGMGGIGVWSDTFQPLPGNIRYETICNFTNMNHTNRDVNLRIRIWIQAPTACPLNSTGQPLSSATCRIATTDQPSNYDSGVIRVDGGQTIQLNLSNVVGSLGLSTANILGRADWWASPRPNGNVMQGTAPAPVQINCSAIARDSSGIMVGADNFIPPVF